MLRGWKLAWRETWFPDVAGGECAVGRLCGETGSCTRRARWLILRSDCKVGSEGWVARLYCEVGG